MFSLEKPWGKDGFSLVTTLSRNLSYILWLICFYMHYRIKKMICTFKASPCFINRYILQIQIEQYLVYNRYLIKICCMYKLWIWENDKFNKRHYRLCSQRSLLVNNDLLIYSLVICMFFLNYLMTPKSLKSHFTGG